MVGPPGYGLPIAFPARGSVLLAGTITGHVYSYGWPPPSRAARLLADRAQRGALTEEPAGVPAGGPVGIGTREHTGGPRDLAPLEVARLHAAPLTHLLPLGGLLFTAAADGTLLISRFNADDGGGVVDRALASSPLAPGAQPLPCMGWQVQP